MIMLAACSPRCPKARHLGHPSFVGELTTPPAREPATTRAARHFETLRTLSNRASKPYTLVLGFCLHGDS
jgi:hypothetical protein